METSTKFILTVLVLGGIGVFFFYRSAGETTFKMDEDSKHLAVINQLDKEAENAETSGHYKIAAERLGEAMKYFDKLHARPKQIEQRYVEIKDRRFRLGLKAEAEETRRKETVSMTAQERLQQKRMEEERKAESKRRQEELAALEEQRKQEELKTMQALLEQENQQKRVFDTVEIDEGLKQRVAVASTQPAMFNKYYNLLKTEFMKDEQGQIVMVPDNLKEVIVDIKADAADQKDAIDRDIAILTQDIRRLEEGRKTAAAQEREIKEQAKDAQRQANRDAVNSHRFSYQRDAAGLAHVTSTWVDPSTRDRAYYNQSRASQYRNQASQYKSQVGQLKGNISAMRAEKIRLEKMSKALTAVASSNIRTVPPKTYWSHLPMDLQNQISRIGVTPDEFRKILDQVGLNDEEFVSKMYVLEHRHKNDDLLVTMLRKMFAEAM